MTLTSELLRDNFPELSEPGLIRDIEVNGKVFYLEAGDRLMEYGDNIRSMPLLLEGSVSVLRRDDQDNEIFLYYLQAGETCAMSLTCCMADKKSEIRAIAEENSAMILLPVHFIDEWIVKHPSWKAFVMDTYRKRFEELLHVVDSVAFQKMDERLWQYLIDKSTARNSHTLEITHQKIADELNSTREVISRLLKQLEKEERLILGRNRINLCL
ncbi:Crp/Fnr family transcriptional regulator [Fulvivirga sp. M361]|uniref:Crp/Fnr family transcriptional regulator n=1 Tax=Fulvivirga sp. M361 TaxID=2594266 RepID=UPI00117A9562|nr:Crp/Fnr family transcriptional regulator [Fulvivirga sp. M361]TRX55937.1 Crp/Fnr family transcriptional regulator [Fulvivirga sp. M361]